MPIQLGDKIFQEDDACPRDMETAEQAWRRLFGVAFNSDDAADLECRGDDTLWRMPNGYVMAESWRGNSAIYEDASPEGARARRALAPTPTLQEFLANLGGSEARRVRVLIDCCEDSSFLPRLAAVPGVELVVALRSSREEQHRCDVWLERRGERWRVVKNRSGRFAGEVRD